MYNCKKVGFLEVILFQVKEQVLNFLRVNKMKIREILISIISLLTLLLVFSGVALADPSPSFYKELKQIDVFHPPTDSKQIPLYNEWHYFNVMDEKQLFSIICTFKLNENRDESEIRLGCYGNDGNSNTYFKAYPLSIAKYSSETPDVTIANNTVRLTPEGYSVHIASDDGTQVLDALFKPEAEPSPELSANGLSQGEVINWIVASPKMEVNGKFIVNGKNYTLNNATGYHDHNWGYWNWRDLGWDWGQVIQTRYHLDGNDKEKYSINFGNITDPDYTRSLTSVLNVWRNREVIATFTNKDMQVNHSNFVTGDISPSPRVILPGDKFPLPLSTNVVVSSSLGDNLNIKFTTDAGHSAPISITIPMFDTDGNLIKDSNGNVITEFRIILEMIGTYQVDGKIKGKPISFTSNGFMEYVSGEPVSPQIKS